MEVDASEGEFLDTGLKIELKTDDESIPVGDVLLVNLPEDAVIKLQECDGTLSVSDIETIDLPVETVDAACCLTASDREINGLPYFTVTSNLIEIKVEGGCEKGEFVADDCIEIMQGDIVQEEICIDQSMGSDLINLSQDIASEVQIKSSHNGENDNSAHSDSSVDMAFAALTTAEDRKEKPCHDEVSIRRSNRIRSIKEKSKHQKKSPSASSENSKGKKKQALKEDVEQKGKTEVARRNRRTSKGRGKGRKKQVDPHESDDNDGITQETSTSNCNDDQVPKNKANTKEPDIPQETTVEVCLPENNIDPGFDSDSVSKDNESFLMDLPTQVANCETSSASSTLSSTSDAKPLAEKNSLEETILSKPEKVKSRWRRSSELEHGDLTTKAPLEPPCDSKPVEIVSCNELLLTSIVEEIPLPKEDMSTAVTVDPEVVKEKVPSYGTIVDNIYRFERKRCKTKKEVRRMLCDCTLTKEEVSRGMAGCDDNCLNRLLMIECGSRCTTGEACSNRRFQNKQYMNVQPFKTEKKGWGLKVLEAVPSGSFVMEYVGEVLSRHEFKQRVKQYAREKCDHYYFMALKSDEIIDATFRGNVSRFINHSCSPNCETQKWTVNGELRIGFFAKRNIEADSELTFDYKFQRYGREAQKCYCESKNCTGFIGEAKPLVLDGNHTNKVSKRKKPVEEKKRQVFEDLMFDEELEKLCGNGGLRNREETLILARLMVRAEDLKSRLRLLDVLLKTTEVACLRLFLDYHGLSLIWSWMANIFIDVQLKARILTVLSLLPVPNKTMLLDSKVLSVVQKWSIELSQSEVTGTATAAAASEVVNEPLSKKIKSNDTSDSDETTDAVAAFAHDASNAQEIAVADESLKQEEKIAKCEGDSSDASLPTKDSAGLSGKVPSDQALSKSDEDSIDKVDSETEAKTDENLTQSLAAKLLDSWSSLKEVFRIPRLEQQKRKADELEADGLIENTIDVLLSEPPLSKDKDSTDTANRLSKDTDGSFAEKSIEVICDRKYAKKIPSLCDEMDRPRNEFFLSQRTLLPTPPRLTKKERRELFAMEVQQRDQETLRKQNDEKKGGVYPTGEYPDSYAQGYYCPETAPYAPSSEVNPYPDGSVAGMPYPNDPSRGTLLPTPRFPLNVQLNVPPPQFSETSGVPFPPPGMVFTNPPPQLPFLGAPPPTLSQPPPAIVNPPVPNNLHAPGMCVPPPLQPPPAQVVRPMPAVMQQPPNIPLPAVASSCLPGPSMVPPLSAPNLLSNSFPVQNNIPSGAPVPGSYLPSTSQFVGNPNPPIYYPYTQGAGSSAVPEVQFTPEDTSPDVDHYAMSKPVKLPPHWKTATDSEGTIYYYHSISRETQWDPPEYDESMEDLGTPTYDEPKKTKRRSTTTAAADTSFAIEVAKKIKELFRTKMSAFVIQCLNVYRKPDCRLGKIQTTDEFKYLARKLTHFVMAKELKHCKNVEELECNDNVKHKAKDYIMKYMSKFGPYYSRDKAGVD